MGGVNLIKVSDYLEADNFQTYFRLSNNKPTKVDQVIALASQLVDNETLSLLCRAYFIKLYSFTPLPL